ncbi:hypothetical protein ACOSQ3_014945 [Xanthoceras sorbifolium]
MVCWSPPPCDWVKVNVDGSRMCDTGVISAGGVIRNSEKVWLSGFAVKKGVGSVLCAEFWGILEALTLAWNLGYCKVIVESDSRDGPTYGGKLWFIFFSSYCCSESCAG